MKIDPFDNVFKEPTHVVSPIIPEPVLETITTETPQASHTPLETTTITDTQLITVLEATPTVTQPLTTATQSSPKVAMVPPPNVRPTRICIVVYDRYFVPLVKKYTKNPQGITLLQRMVVGIAIHVVIMIIASVAERRRLSVAKDHGITEKGQTVPLSIFVLLPQFVLMGAAHNFLEVAKLDFFYGQAPEGMKSHETAYFTTSLGVGFFLSSFILSIVANVTKRYGHKGWILDNLNESRLNYYYVFLTVLCFLNFIFFFVIVKNFDYKAR
ncbi:proton-dependent oligopeptide transporter family [Artemisia annua]|uniref:Proton-dependent oligopeptide transporter family n=1 Tax=Artemisia annua TaxID=35608 RepID=A0A2U1KGZ6_ARTAN|nr:proton-dependent oligopeptide transporter family [Artemisia annua]